jgi:antitoxin CptB
MSRLPDPEIRRRRILFRATHRGTYENDILIGSFVRDRLDRFTETELDELERVMDYPEPIIADWLMGRAPIPPDADCPILREMFNAAHHPGTQA